MTGQGNKDNWIVFTLKPWALQYGQQFFQTQCHFISIPNMPEKSQTVITPIYYTINELLLLPFLLTNNLNRELKIIIHNEMIETPLGNYIAQRGLDLYHCEEEPQKWEEDLKKQSSCFLWFPRNVFTNKEQGLKYHLGLSSLEEPLNHIGKEFKTLFQTDQYTTLKFFLCKTHFYPSIFDDNPLETICNISYEELAYGILKELNINNTILDKDHIIEMVFLEYPEITDYESHNKKSHEVFNKLSTRGSIDFETLLYKLVAQLFPVRYSSKNFRNRFLYLLQKAIEKQNTPLTSVLKTIHTKIATGEPFSGWDKMLDFLEKQGLCRKNTTGIYIKKRKFLWGENKILHTIKPSSDLGIIDPAINTLQKIKWIPNFILSYSLSKKFYKDDVAIFEEDFTRFFHPEWSKDADVGRPFFYHVVGSQIGIILSHGYLSAPMEVKALANYLYKQGYSVYGIRMKGHGTSPLDLAHSSYEEWFSALNRGIACMRARCEKIFLCGFSAGGCLVLSASATKQNQIEGVISISAPLKLQNYAINLVPTISTLNSVLKRFGGSGWELFDHHPENPHINYTKNPLAGLQQLRLLMEKTEELLPQVTIPTLIIQGSNDTTVNPESANIIFQSISSEHKKMIFFNRTRHGIINGPGSEEIFATVSQFIKEVSVRKYYS